MGFDLGSMGVGVLAGWASAYGVYRARHVIQQGVQSVNTGAQNVQNSATRSADSRYISDLITQCETTHLAGNYVKLSEIIVEPRFLAPESFVVPADDEPYPSPYEVIPNIPDQPYLQAPFSVETLSIDELASGSRALALLGLPGTGRTTALFSIALHSLGRVKFLATPDKVQQRLDSEDSKLAEKERAVRVKERLLIEQRARERLANEVGVNFDKKNEDQEKDQLPLFNRLMPAYVHLADLHLLSGEFGGQIDPAEPIVKAIQSTVKRVTASTIPRNLYTRLSRGQVLLLVDGFDELPPPEQLAALDWLRSFRELYGQNFLIVVGPATGYAPLTKIGLTPIYLSPWNDLDSNALITRFGDSWQRISKTRQRKEISKEVLALTRANNRALSTSEVVFKVWTGFANDANMVGLEGWMRAYLSRQMPKWEESLNTLIQMGALQLDEGFISAARLQALATNPDSTESALVSPSAGSLLQARLEDDPAVEADAEAEPEEPVNKKDSETTSIQGRLLGAMRRTGLMTRFRGDRYRFRSSQLASYLASLTLKAAPLEKLKQKVAEPTWRHAVAYTTINRPMDDLIRELVKSPNDMLYDQYTMIARWLAYAPADVKWRGNILNYLSAQFIAPSQYPVVRERTAAALIASRDRNVLIVFRKGVRNTDPIIRRLACLAMGAIGDPEALRDLKPLIDDRDSKVQIAAGIALGAIGTDEALQTMVIALTTGSDQLRQVMAEAFAALPEEGYPTLFDAIHDEDLALRRAAIFGLRRIRSTWALLEIYRAFLADEQWYVKSAAQQAFQERQFGRTVSMTTPYPRLDEVNWLKKWATQRGETIPTGAGSTQILLKALQEGDTNIRALAARNIGQILMIDATKALYSALRDGREEVRTAAHRALSEFQIQLGHSLPTPL